ncbi:heterokaryon incompatibility protein-domain-containing protein, partial [Xylogone sp. PMI_703]
LALQWVADCIDGHPGCKPAHVNFSPPTRILEIIPDEDSEKYDLKLLEKFDPAEPYVALSHCWGEYQSHPLQTTKQSLPAHLSRIPFEKLPKSFQDATTVASRLGVRRLWIDSLCIIQDDIADWEKECPLMADIYSRALVTIAASDAANSNAGFLGEYPSSLRCNIGGLIQIRCIPTFITSPVAHNEESILSGRGWALQEAIFSPRFLSFKRERLQWHCTKESRSDDILMPYWSKFDTRRAERPTIAKLLTWDERRVYESWRDIVTNFSQTKLTKPTDKLPALSGLAKAICNSLGDRYAAGVFLKDVHNMLCWTFYQPNEWRKCSENEEPSLGSEPMAYRAPSWSWASTDGELEFYSHIYFRDFEILDCQAASAGHDPFGEVTTGFIRGRGLLKRLALGNFCFRTETWGFGKIYLDHASDQAYYDTCKKQSELRPIILLLLGYDKYETRIMKGDYTYSLHDPRRRKYWRQSDAIPEDQEGGESIWQRRWVALVLGMMPEKGPDCFCRIGLATGEDCKGGEWFDGCVRETITLF